MKSKKQVDKDWLYQKYIVEELSPRQIGGICGYSPRQMARIIKKTIDNTRSRAESVRTAPVRKLKSIKMVGRFEGAKNPMYKGGWSSGGYRFIKIKGRDTRLHRFLVEQKIGRKLSRNEVVHHKDENKSNNNIDNLEVMTISQHSKEHQKHGGYRKNMKPWNYRGGRKNGNE